ncbi:MAG TPA: response regulator [Pyrinomonadaceae bacterium]|jgi:chemosensory pili system protein ChpA (sensor histidine kinase/response regulator)
MNTSLQIQNDSQTSLNTTSLYFEVPRPLILIAESDEEKRELLKTLLDLYDVGVIEAQTGEEAMDVTVGARPDLVLINTDLPGLDGFETTRLIRAIKSFDDMPIVFISHETERIYRKKAFDVGGNCFHIAPLDLERLDHILENYLFCINGKF